MTDQDQTRKDISQDFDHLEILFQTLQKEISAFIQTLEKQKQHIPSFLLIKQASTSQEKIIRAAMNTIASTKKQLTEKSLTKAFITSHKIYITLYDQYRTLKSITAGIMTASDFQSPTFGYSVNSLAGRQTGTIIPHFDDYKRDEHSDAKSYAFAFRDTYLKGTFKFRITPYATSSGMAALTTIINFLQMEKKITGPVLLGASSYFQNKELIEKLFPKVTKIHEHQTEKIKTFIQKNQPQAVFFDSLCNASDMAIPNLTEIISNLQKYSKKDVYLIIDNTCLAASLQPLQFLSTYSPKVHIIVFESLNKYYQFGLDRAMGGIIYTRGSYLDPLFAVRQHSGTILSASNCYELPTPNKTILFQRLRRHQRNTNMIVAALQKEIIQFSSLPITAIISPLLPDHPAVSWTKEYEFLGSFFTFTWQNKYENIKTYTKFIRNVMNEAKKEQLQIVEGTSFGMNTTRIYLTAPNTKFGKPFVRISVGTENYATVQKIISVLIHALHTT